MPEDDSWDVNELRLLTDAEFMAHGAEGLRSLLAEQQKQFASQQVTGVSAAFVVENHAKIAVAAALAAGDRRILAEAEQEWTQLLSTSTKLSAMKRQDRSVLVLPGDFTSLSQLSAFLNAGIVLTSGLRQLDDRSRATSLAITALNVLESRGKELDADQAIYLASNLTLELVKMDSPAWRRAFKNFSDAAILASAHQKTSSI